MEVKLTAENFKKEVLDSEIPVLVDFWAPWCPPCRMMIPVVEELAKEYEGRVKVGKVNVDQHQDLAAQYQVMSVPSFKIFKNGKVIAEFMGVQTKERIIEEIEKALKS